MKFLALKKKLSPTRDMSGARVVIIGNGISGVTAARHLRKNSDIPITIISDEGPYFFSRTALMYVYMGHMKFHHTKPYEDSFWKKNRIELCKGRVERINDQENCVVLQSDETIHYSSLIIACGSKPNKFGWPGQDLKGVSGMYHHQDLQKLEKWSNQINTAVIVGGGLIGVELAEMLHSRGIHVHYLVRESSFWDRILPKEESEMITKHIMDHGINLELDIELKEIEGDKEQKVKGIYTSAEEYIKCEYVGLTCGVSPNIDFLRNSNSNLNLDRGVLVNRYLETNIPNIYAIGDCAQQNKPIEKRPPIEAVWYTGRMMGETVAQTLIGNRTAYNPGPWFNSAKFFDIEYQTYGWVSANNDPRNEEHIYWQHPEKNISLRLAYNPTTRIFLGVVNMGIRLKHEIFHKWLSLPTSINYVIEHLIETNFDPEFYPNYLKIVKKQFLESEELHTNA